MKATIVYLSVPSTKVVFIRPFTAREYKPTRASKERAIRVIFAGRYWRSTESMGNIR